MAEQDVINEVVRRVKDFNRRVRDLEEKVRNLNARMNTAEDTILDKTKALNSDIGDLRNDLASLQDRAEALEVDVKNLQRNQRKTVTQREFEEVKSFVEVMDPVQSKFVTEDEVEELLKAHDGGGGGMTKHEVNRMIKNKLDERLGD